MTVPRARALSSSGGGGGGGNGIYKGNPSVRGLDFYLGDEQDDYRGYTAFRLQELIAKGEHGWAGDYAGWCFEEMLATSLRWFCRWHNTGYCPETDPNFYDNFGKTLELCKKFGRYGHPVASCDQAPGSGSRVLTTDEKLADSVRRMCDIARQVGNCFPFEKENEPFKNGMKGKLWPTEWFHDLVWCPGTWYLASDVNPNDEIGPWGPCQTIHPGGDREWVSEGGRVCQETMREKLGQYPAPRVPTFVGEPVRIAEEGRTAEQYAAMLWNCRNMGRGGLVHGGFHSLGPQTSHHASDLQNCKIPTGEALRTCQLVRNMWKSPLWIKNSASEGTYTRAAVLGPDDDPMQFGEVPGVGHVRIFPQTDTTCPLTHWDRWIDVGEKPGRPGAQYEDPRGAGRTYFMKMGDGRASGGPLDGGSQCNPHARQGYRVVDRDGPIWIMAR